MKQLLLLATWFFSFSAIAQTPLIAHKSHSGNYSSYFIDPNSNFGQIAPQYRQQVEPEFRSYEPELNESFQPINDTTVVKLTTNKENLLIRVDTISKRKYETIEQVKLKHSRYPVNLQNQNNYMEGGKRKSEVIVGIVPPDNNTPSFLLIFAAVSVVGMIMYRIFFSRSTVTQVY